MQSKNWNFLQPSLETVRQLCVRLEISTTLAALLANRGITSPEEAELFLDPTLDQLHDPFLMLGMEEAVRILADTIRSRKPILVYGDYDVDGVTGTALLVSYLRQFTNRVSFTIPHRVLEGYGLQAERLRRFAAEGGGLVLSVDCGISHAAEVEEGRRLGLSFIITDHHEPPEILPKAEAIINPLQPGCSYPFKHLAGVGIAFKLIQGLDSRRRPSGDGPAAASVFSFLDLAALGTVADIVPLRDENRVLVRHGLALLNKPARAGVTALKTVSGMGSRTLKSSHIAFTLGPRINAAGRLGRAEVAVELLLEKDPARAMELAGELNEENRRRQQIDAGILQEALHLVDETPSLMEDNILILSSPDWHSGVIGVVASKLAERYTKPTILISTEDDPGRGSARSVPNFDLFSALQECRHLLEAFGGHSYAAGLSILQRNIAPLRDLLNSLSPSSLPASGDRPLLNIDARVDFQDLRSDLLSELNRLMPFGYTNPAPTFLAERVFLNRQPWTVGRNHLRLSLAQKPHVRQAIGFNMGHLLNSFAGNLSFNIAYTLDLDPNRSVEQQQLRLSDIQFPYSFEPAHGVS
jgi:single-stranded-DNA-specific exonuclease